ncbi:MAG: hypothetical protein VX084_05645, partial [Planctomycetota bacterium]|nr:hypothetical protein [Planctomycetota bacterium]
AEKHLQLTQTRNPHLSKETLGFHGSRPMSTSDHSVQQRPANGKWCFHLHLAPFASFSGKLRVR